MIQILLEELIGVATSEKDGLMPSIQRMTTSYQKDQQKYCKIAEFRNRLTGISMLISVFKNHENSSPSVVLLTGYSDDLSVNSIKRGIYLTNVYYQKKENKTIVYVKSSAYVYISTLCIGMNGSLKLSHENNLDLPSDAIEIPISWQEFSNIWELGGLIGTATANKNGLMSKIFAVTDIERGKGLIIDYKADSNGLYTSSSLIEIYVYSGANTAFYRVMSIPIGSKNIEIKYMGVHWCDFKYADSKLYVLPKSDDSSISYKVSLVRRTRPIFSTIDFSDFSNITGEIITPTPD